MATMMNVRCGCKIVGSACSASFSGAVTDCCLSSAIASSARRSKNVFRERTCVISVSSRGFASGGVLRKRYVAGVCDVGRVAERVGYCLSSAIVLSPRFSKIVYRNRASVVSVSSISSANGGVMRRRELSEVRDVARAAGGGSGADDDNRDDAGVIKDMELYLDNLSLEYDSVWDTKPAWCQPWTIVASGLGVLSLSWFLFHNVVVTGGATFGIGFWWFSFLYAYPIAYAEMISQRRKMIKEGSEDTYGRKRSE